MGWNSTQTNQLLLFSVEYVNTGREPNSIGNTIVLGKKEIIFSISLRFVLILHLDHKSSALAGKVNPDIAVTIKEKMLWLRQWKAMREGPVLVVISTERGRWFGFILSALSYSTRPLPCDELGAARMLTALSCPLSHSFCHSFAPGTFDFSSGEQQPTCGSCWSRGGWKDSEEEQLHCATPVFFQGPQLFAIFPPWLRLRFAAHPTSSAASRGVYTSQPPKRV